MSDVQISQGLNYSVDSQLIKQPRQELNNERGNTPDGVKPEDSPEHNGEGASSNEQLISEVKDNLARLNDVIPVTATNLQFQLDEEGDPPVVLVLDKSSNEVIREIPSKEFREVAKALEEFADKLTKRGVLFDRTA
ncbi:flagellar biosynthesis protein FlaG [Pseudoalteromonas sp. A22]|uniref:flagellar protein FlaG n=1 Tax=Pseudoalteromonas TaxID=53246 RepID=UPI001BAAC000|nr:MULTISPECIES: flagellar protein FlaG [Pseudoalteromonas]QUI63000.1 flagellar biosynthesis protein FlaG [Pseudoalteromonas sp. A22]USE68665.1 flagellar biosynthesis protein FlaG [Pseudoalteromonas flavipulchra]